MKVKAKREKCIASKDATESEGELDGKEIVMLIRNSSASSTKIQMQEEENEAIKRIRSMCFKCRKPRHIKENRPME